MELMIKREILDGNGGEGQGYVGNVALLPIGRHLKEIKWKSL